MRSACAALLALVMVLPAAISTARAELAADQAPLGQFVPATPPQPVPKVDFTDAAGRAVSLDDFAGKLVLVNLWATWCAPCRREMPSLEQLQTRLGDKLAILAISEDIGGSKAVAPFVAKLGLKAVKVYLDPKNAVSQAFKVDGLPTSVSDRPPGPGARTRRRRGRLGFAQDAGGHRAAVDPGRHRQDVVPASAPLRKSPPRRSPSSLIEWPMPGQLMLSTGTPACFSTASAAASEA